MAEIKYYSKGAPGTSIYLPGGGVVKFLKVRSDLEIYATDLPDVQAELDKMLGVVANIQSISKEQAEELKKNKDSAQPWREEWPNSKRRDRGTAEQHGQQSVALSQPVAAPSPVDFEARNLAAITVAGAVGNMSGMNAVPLARPKASLPKKA